MKKEKQNKSKKRIVVTTILLLVIVIIAITLLIVGLKLLSSGDKKVKPSNEFAQDTLYNNFLISYLLTGDVKVAEGSIHAVEGGPTYYAVNDPLLKNIKSMDQIINLIHDNLIYPGEINARKLLSSDKSNQYRFAGDTMYVLKTKSICKNLDNAINKKEIKLERINGEYYSVLNRIPYQLYQDESDSDKYKLGILHFTCKSDEEPEVTDN